MVRDPQLHGPTFEGCHEGGEVTEGLTLGESGLFILFGPVRKIRGSVPIGLLEGLVPLGAEFLEGLGRYIFIPFFSYFFESWFRECVFFRPD